MKHICLILFLFLVAHYKAQNYINDVIGRYQCTRIILNNSNVQTAPSCVCYLDLFPNTLFPVCINYEDSCFGGTGWDHISQDVEVLVDSSFKGYEPWAQPWIASGKLYANDSIFYRIYYPNPSNHWKEFRGFKLYSFVGIEHLNKPENDLMISPQPANDIMYIQSTQVSFTQKERPVFYGLSGKEIILPVQFINANTYKLDVSDMDAGIYFVMIKTDKGTVRKKFVVQH